MNRQHFYILVAFLVGIILTQYFSKNQTTEMKPQAEVQTEVEPTKIPKKKIVAKSAATLEIEKAIAPPAPSVYAKPDQAKTVTPQQVFQEPQQQLKKRVDLILDEHHVRQLEQNINDLSFKVRINREDRGWRINYVSNQNSMAQMGIMNNDLILFDFIESIRQEPGTESLVTRLERVFYTLEK